MPTFRSSGDPNMRVRDMRTGRLLVFKRGRLTTSDPVEVALLRRHPLCYEDDETPKPPRPGGLGAVSASVTRVTADPEPEPETGEPAADGSGGASGEA